MAESAGVDRLRRRIETDLLEASIAGPSLIAVGPRAGRCCSSLTRPGLVVTAVVGSRAAQTESLPEDDDSVLDIDSAGLPRRLPSRDEAYDSLVSLDGALRSSEWCQNLPEWVRVVRPGGILVFDIASFDSLCVDRGVKRGEPGPQAPDLTSGRSLVAAGNLVAEADEHGVVVVDVIPCDALVEGGRASCLPAIQDTHWWRRLLTWLATDDRLLDFASFLQQELIGRLPGVVPGRSIVIFEHRPDPQQNRAWLRAQEELAARVARGISLDALAPYLRMPATEIKARLDGHLSASMRNFRFFDGLCQGIALCGAGIDIASFVETDALARLEDWSRRRKLDHEVTVQARDWLAAPGAAETMRLDGVELGDALEYYLVEDLLTRYHGLFTGVRS